MKLGLIRDRYYNVEVFGTLYNEKKPEYYNEYFGLVTVDSRCILLVLHENGTHFNSSFSMSKDELDELLIDLTSLESSNNFTLLNKERNLTIEFAGDGITLYKNEIPSLIDILTLKSFKHNPKAQYILEDLKYVDYFSCGIMSLDELVMYDTVMYPNSYFYENIEQTKFNICDHLFSVIGNGFGTNRDIKLGLSKTHLTDKIITKYKVMRTEPMFKGYTEIDERYKEEGMTFGKIGSRIKELWSEQEKKLKPEVVFWEEFIPKKDNKFRPYQSLTKEGSSLYNTTVFQNYPQWMDAAHWYYSQCADIVDSKHKDFISETIKMIEDIQHKV